MLAAPMIRRSATAFALFAVVAALTFATAAPALAAAPGDGHGAMAISPSSVAASSTTTLTMTFTAGTSMNNTGAHVAVTVPAGWTAPTTSAGAGQVTATNVDCNSAGPASVSVMTIDVPISCGNGKKFTITYATATAPSSQGTSTFTTQSAGGGSGTTLTNIAVQPTVTVGPPLDHFAVSAPASATAGAAFSYTVTAETAANATITSYTGTVHFTSSDGSATLPADYTFVGGDSGTHTFTNGVTLETVGTQTVDVNDTVQTSVTGSASVNVSAGSIDHFDVSAPATSSAGDPFSVTVTAQDAFDNTITGYAGTVHFTSSDGGATLPADYTFVGGDNGVHTFTNEVTLVTAGTQTVDVNDTVTTSATGSADVDVSADGLDHFDVSAPSTATAGDPFSVTVTAQDAFDNTITDYAGTIHFASSDGSATLPADYTFVGGDSGSHTFTNEVTLETAGTQSVDANDTVQTSMIGSASVDVSAAAIDHFDVSAPSSATAGDLLSVTVTAKDAFDNTISDYAGTVHFASSDGSATLPADYTFVGGDSGVHTFTNEVTLVTAGTQTVDVNDTVTTSATGSASVEISTAALDHFDVSAPGTTTAGDPFSVTVTAQDAYDNTITDYVGTVHVASSDGGATLPVDYTFVGGGNGVHTFTNEVTLVTAGTQTVDVNDTVATSATGSADVDVSAAALDHFDVSAPGTTTAGDPFSVTVTAQDAFDNTITGYAGTVHVASSDGGATLPSDYTFVGGDNGSHTFTNEVTLVTAGTQTVDVNDAVTTSATGSADVDVSATTLDHLDVSAPGTAISGTPFSVTVTAQDAFDNTITDYAGTVTFASSDGSATLPADYAFVGGDLGSHTFTNGVTLVTAGTQSVDVNDTVATSVVGSADVDVSAGAVDHLDVSAPGTTTAGDPFSVTVTAQDASDNTITDYAGTVHFASSDGAATLPSDYTFVGGDNGSHTFTNEVTLVTAGTQTVDVNDTVATSATGSADVDVTVAALDHFDVSAPGTTTAGDPFSVTVTAQDAFDNTITDYAGTVQFASSDGGATLPADYTFVVGDNGVHTFTNGVTLVTVGTQSVDVNDSVATSVVGSADVDVATAVDHFDISAPATTPARSPFTVTVTAMDASDDPVTDYAGTVHFTSSDGSATLPANYTFVGGDNGSHTFTDGVTLQTVGTQSVKARDTVDNSINGTVNVTVMRVKHARTITLRLRGSLRAVGRVRAVDGFAMCVDTVKVNIQRWVSGRWIVIKRLQTTSTGRYRVQLLDRPGKYRAVARRTKSAQDVCRKAVSPARRNI
jgi:hypothetical protein